MKPSRTVQTYEGKEVTVTFDRSRCIHSEESVRGLPAVFEPTRRRWIRPDEAAPEDVIAGGDGQPAVLRRHARTDRLRSV